ncbi:MAG: DUF368 domain-containing protein [Clostridiales bacterium]|nr:DUF368 domain-containing protein [Clostridiales bacterium]
MKQTNNKLKNDLTIMIKGFLIGSSMSVPGVSGGTMAILLGIYDKLISSISNFLKDIKGNVLFLMKFCIGAGLGIGSLAFVIKWLLETFPIPISFFFLGAVIGGIPALIKKTKETRLNIVSAIYFIVGLILVISIGYLPKGNINIGEGSGITQYIMILITGIVIALALVLPGISTSHMLLVMGMYDRMLVAITEFDIVFIGVLGISTLIGIFLITKPIEYLMNRFTHQTYCMIIGFVLGSTSEVFKEKIIPAIPRDTNYTWWILAIIISLVTFVLGYYGILYLSRFSDD